MGTFTSTIPVPAVGTAATAAYADAVANAINAFGAWTSYTPAWTASTTNPTIGNGTITGSYCQIEKLVYGRFHIVLGSTSTAGSGTYSISLPVTSAAYVSEDVLGSGIFRDNSATARYPLTMFWASTTTVIPLYLNASPLWTALTAIAPAVPAVSDVISGQFMYEAA